jgi:hypothetical protein
VTATSNTVHLEASPLPAGERGPAGEGRDLDAIERAAATQPPALGPRELLRCAGLLAGLGAHAGALAEELLGATHTPADGRTCVDAGSQLMFALAAPGPRELRVLARMGSPAVGVARWLRANQRPAAAERWLTESYAGEPPEAWAGALAAARYAGGEERLRRYHAAIGVRGRIFSAAWSIDDGAPRATVGWQLDRSCAPAQALEALGLGHAWPAAAALLGELIGQPVGAHTGPWSVACALHDDSPRVRVGTTRWARSLEDEAKRRRLSTLFTRLAAAARFPGPSSSPVPPSGPPVPPARIGRAVELELAGSRPVALEAYLCPT